MSKLLTRYLGCEEYTRTYKKMCQFTEERTGATDDELWLLEHGPVYTQGRAGKAEHILDAGKIPIVQTDRGGQISYHGPGQLVAYPLLDLRRLRMNVRELVSVLENAAIEFLDYYGVQGAAEAKAPGIYVKGKKIASLGLRIRKSCSLHGIALNIDMDMAPFSHIHPCGYPGLEMTQLKQFVHPAKLPSLEEAGKLFANCLRRTLDAHRSAK